MLIAITTRVSEALKSLSGSKTGVELVQNAIKGFTDADEQLGRGIELIQDERDQKRASVEVQRKRLEEIERRYIDEDQDLAYAQGKAVTARQNIQRLLGDAAR